MYKAVNIELIYVYVLLSGYLKKIKKCEKELFDFFEQGTFFCKKNYYVVRMLLSRGFDISEFASVILKNRNNEPFLREYLLKIQNLLSVYFNEITEGKLLSGKKLFSKIESHLKNLKKYKNNEYAFYFYDILNFIQKNLKNNKKDIDPRVFSFLYSYLEEYLDMFKNAKDITFDHEYFKKHTEPYFRLLYEDPVHVVFHRNNKNIKVMQNLIPNEVLDKTLSLIGYKTNLLSEKYFTLECDDRLISKETPELLGHEIGHLLNLNVYNFQNLIFQELYSQAPSIDTIMLNGWLNEILADLVGYGFYGEKFIKTFDLNLKDNTEADNYPPLEFRKIILKNKKFDPKIFKTKEKAALGSLIFNNIDKIKETISFVTN